jgi:hypothetical protein
MMPSGEFSTIRSPFWAALGANRFSLLLITLLLTIGGSAFLSEMGWAGVLNVLILLDLLVLLAVLTGRWVLRTGLVLFTLSLVSWILLALSGATALQPAGQVGAILLFVLGTLGCFRMAFSPGPVERERLAASLSFYLLLGLMFALLFTVIAELLPGSFHFSATRPAAVTARPLADLIYFSFVTLATLGYGDIVPLSPSAKGLAILEAILGQIYLVVVVARLVSLYGKSEAG